MSLRPYRVRDLTGHRVARLTALEYAGNDKQGNALWRCSCDCGRTSLVRSYALRVGRIKSCGCWESRRERRKHGQAAPQSPEYKAWSSAVQRCTNPRHPSYRNYGGRGVRICEEWRRSFVAFFNHMGPRPPGLTLDRIDNDGHYEPGNCRWTTYTEQIRNRRKLRRRAPA